MKEIGPLPNAAPPPKPTEPPPIERIYDALSTALGHNLNDDHQNGWDAVATLASQRDAALRSLERVRVVATIPPKTALVLDDSDAFLAVVRLRHDLRDAIARAKKAEMKADIWRLARPTVTIDPGPEELLTLLRDAAVLLRATQFEGGHKRPIETVDWLTRHAHLTDSQAGDNAMPTAGESPAPIPPDVDLSQAAKAGITAAERDQAINALTNHADMRDALREAAAQILKPTWTVEQRRAWLDRYVQTQPEADCVCDMDGGVHAPGCGLAKVQPETDEENDEG